MIDQAHLDLTPVPGVHRSRGVDHAQPHPGGQTRSRVHESGVPLGQRDRDARTHQRTFTRLENQIGCRHQVGTRITNSGVGRNRDIGVKTGQQDLHARHEPRDYPEAVSDSAEAAIPAGDSSGRASSNARPLFRERLYASWWTWPLPLVAAVLLAAEVHMGYPGLRAWLPYAVLVPLAIGVPLALSRTKVEVRDGELWVGDAHLPLRVIDDVEVVSAADKRRALGPDLDPAAFAVHRPWVSTSLRVWLDDDEDPTPYWIVSTRHPEKLADALRTG